VELVRRNYPLEYFVCCRWADKNCAQMTSSVGLQQSTLFYFLLVIGQCFPKWLPMIPDGAQQVIKAGSSIILTCIYQYRDEHDTNFGNIWWKLPDYVEKNPVI
jgi:hypothetical protein